MSHQSCKDLAFAYYATVFGFAYCNFLKHNFKNHFLHIWVPYGKAYHSMFSV